GLPGHASHYVDGIRFGVFAFAWLFENPLRGGSRRRLLQSVLESSSRTSFSECVANGVGRTGNPLLSVPVAGCDCGAGCDPTDDSVSCADCWCDCFPCPETGRS